MNNVGNYLVMKEFNEMDSKEVIFEKIKDMFEVNQHFVNMYDDEEHTVESINGSRYNSQLEEIFEVQYKEGATLLEIKELIEKIGHCMCDSYDEEYGQFSISYIENEDKITIAISLCIYFI